MLTNGKNPKAHSIWKWKKGKLQDWNMETDTGVDKSSTFD